jgi:hypothetical protein
MEGKRGAIKAISKAGHIFSGCEFPEKGRFIPGKDNDALKHRDKDCPVLGNKSCPKMEMVYGD